MNTINTRLLAEIRKHYKLRWYGTHGIIHWYRVYENGIKLSEQAGVKQKVVQLFSIFHDSQRRNECLDPKHGKRGAELAFRLRDYLSVNDEEFQLLTTACSLHTSAKTHDDITVQACFDADRLDLGRVGSYPNHKLLSTPMAKQKDTIEWAYYRSRNQIDLPDTAFGLGGSSLC